jgi:hypothetical protein
MEQDIAAVRYIHNLYDALEPFTAERLTGIHSLRDARYVRLIILPRALNGEAFPVTYR